MDRRRQLPRDPRPPARARRLRRGPRPAVVAVLRTGAAARLPDARRAARGVRLLALPSMARRVAAGRSHLAAPPLRHGARAPDDLAAPVAGGRPRAAVPAR